MDTPDGTGIRDYIHLDLADGHVKALKNLENSSSKILNINLGTELNRVLELIKTFEKVNKLKFLTHMNLAAGDYAKVVADSKLAKILLNWEPKEILNKCVEMDGSEIIKS